MSQKETLPPRGERVADRTARTLAILDVLDHSYPDARCALDHSNAWQLLVATILSAQCTDARVNMVTPALFARFPDPISTAGADVAEVEMLVQSTGFFRQKAKNIVTTAQKTVNLFNGKVPRTMPELLMLSGVARKTANVVISNCFPENAVGIAVDTHVQRISRRLGLTREFDPVSVERDLMKLVPEEWWNRFTHVVIDHGRTVCKAPRPLCSECPLAELCPSSNRF